MKVFKNKKQRFLAVFLSLVFVMMLVPFTDVYASDYVPVADGTLYNWSGIASDNEVVLRFGLHSPTNNDIVFIKLYSDDDSNFTYYAISLGTFQYNVYESTTGHTCGLSSVTRWSTSKGDLVYLVSGFDTYLDGSTYYHVPIDNFGGAHVYSVHRSSYVDKNLRLTDYLYYILTSKDVTGLDCTYTDSEHGGGGGHDIGDAPLEDIDATFDASLGYPKVNKSTYVTGNNEVHDFVEGAQYFNWGKKTSTGFNLVDNDYRMTYIEVKIESRMQYNQNLTGTGSWYKYDSYGENGILKRVLASRLSTSVSPDELKIVLPKSANESHPFVAQKREFVYYFRVVAMKTDSLLVIPNEEDCEYFAGPWRSVTVSKTDLGDESSIVEDGNFDDDNKWVPDDDSTDNGKDIDNGHVDGDTIEDAENKVDNGSGSSNSADITIEDAISVCNQLLEMIKNLPQIFAMIFSFLPTWCVNIIGVFFIALAILAIYKLARG